MEFMLRWMTDGAVGFESDTLADTGDYPYYVITTGRVFAEWRPKHSLFHLSHIPAYPGGPMA